MPENNDKSCKAPEISDDDVYEAMKEINGYIDISMSDFRELYLKACRHAIERYEHSVKAGKIMTTEVISAGADTGLQEIAELLAKHDISGIPVISAEKTVIGVISEKDFLRRMISSTSLNFMSVIAECIGNKDRFFAPSDLVMLIGSFGASAVLVYGAVKSPIAQPRNVIGGHMISAFIGVATLKLIPDPLWLSSGISVATAIVAMHATKTLHPPGGATALIAVTGGETIKSLGFMYVFLPAGAGAILLLVVALVINNIPKNRKYPEFWL